MNRIEKRKLNNQVKQIAYDKKLAEGIKQLAFEAEETFIPEGTKVKLNYQRIRSNPDYDKNNPYYNDFIEEHKEDILTVQYDTVGKPQEHPLWVCFEEDTSVLKWLFCIHDLIVCTEL